MMIIGVDYHPSFQEIAFLVEETGEYGEQKLNHSEGEAERFYRDLHARGIHVRVGMEATGFSRWFERLLAALDFELWIGDPAEIKAKRTFPLLPVAREVFSLDFPLYRTGLPSMWARGGISSVCRRRTAQESVGTRTLGQGPAATAAFLRRRTKEVYSARAGRSDRKFSV